jgi:glycosyltransferase involved in cell wall biosynthesis
MRIGILTGALGGGGAERQAEIWTRLCVREGHLVTAVVLWRDPEAAVPAGVELVHHRKTSFADLAAIARRLRRMQGRLDALIVFEPYLGLCAALARLGIPWMLVTGKVPYVLRDGSRIPLGAYRWAFDRATLASAPNEAMVEAHRQLGIRPERPWAVVPNIADSEAFVDSDAERGGVLYVGRLVPVKNPVLAVESAAAARAPLTILGEGELQGEVERVAARRRQAPPWEICACNGRPWPAYASHRVLVVTSHYESFGNAIVESLAAGTPVVSVDCDFGPRAIIGGARYSHLTSPDVSSIAAALTEVLERPYSDAEATECRAIAGRYTIDAVGPTIVGAIDALGG